MMRSVTLLFALFAVFPCLAQDEDMAGLELTEKEVARISNEMEAYLQEVSDIMGSISSAKLGNVAGLDRRLQSIDVRWKAYTNLEQVGIASTPLLMEMMSQYQVFYLAACDSVNVQKKRLMARNDLEKALAFIKHQSQKYDNFTASARKLSMLPQTAQQLGELKDQEQLVFQEVTKQYQVGVSAVSTDPRLAGRRPELDKVYINVKMQSEMVQAAAYKSFLERIKDYVMTFAGVSIILMFFGMVSSKISAAKAARDAAKKFSQNMNKTEYPTI